VRTKVCRTCQAEKPLRQFYCHPSYADGHMNDCKECKKAYSREMHWLKREVILAKKRQYSARPEQRAARRAYAKTPRGQQVMRESRRVWRVLRQMEAA
jgi:hypothetical protein